MKTSNDLPNSFYQDLNKTGFTKQKNYYKRMVKWLVVVNTISWLAVAYLLLKYLSI